MNFENLLQATSAWSPSLSPDGESVAYVSDRSGAPRLWISRVDGTDERWVDTGPEPIREARWSCDGEYIAVSIAPGGAPRTEVWVVRPDGSDLKRLGAESEAATYLGPWSPSSPSIALAHTTNPPHGVAVLYDARTGRGTEIARGGLPFVFAIDAGHRRILLRRGPRGDRTFWCIDRERCTETELSPGGESGSTDLGRLSPDGSTAYIRSNVGREFYGLFAVSLDGGADSNLRLVDARSDSELEDLLLTQDGRFAALLWNRAGRSDCELMDLVTGSRRDLLLPEPVAYGGGFSSDGRLLTLTLEGPTHPKAVYVVDIEHGTFRRVTSQPSGFVPPTVTPTLERLRSDDGLEITGWLYRATNSAGAPGAAVVHFHGGPEVQERPGYNPLFQALAASGIAVFAPNIRGSAGFGRSFINADNREKRWDAIADVAACARYIVNQGVAAPEKLACAGRSYGGYLTLAALVFHPDLFAAGVDVCGMADLHTFYRDTEPSIAVAAYPKYGHPVEHAELLRELSPIHRFDALRAPLLVVHGANDTNVPLGEAEQAVSAARQRGIPVEYLLFPDEGHELLQKKNKEVFVARTVQFLRTHLLADTTGSDGLLEPDEPPPFTVLEGAPDSPFLLTCDHAGKLLPRALGDLGLAPADLERHIAWDIGAARVAEHVARALDGFLILQTYSRLAIDCNRPLDAKSSIAAHSEATTVPGNQNLSPMDAQRRADAIFHPYHRRIEQELERRRRAGIPTVYLAVHSFTPRFLEVDRPWHIGVLYGRDARFAHVLLDVLRGEPGLVVGDNEPYFVSDLTDYGVPYHAERRNLLHVELEIRQDLIQDEEGQRHWAALLTRAILSTMERLGAAVPGR